MFAAPLLKVYFNIFLSFVFSIINLTVYSGTGIQNLRECIIETKWKYDVAPEDKQVGWKALILDFMERYFYLICFATYALQEGHGGYQKSFSSWMDDHKELRMMIGELNS